MHALHAVGLLLLERLAADEVAALVERHGPGEPGFPRRDVLVHVLAVEIHAGFEAQRVARAEPRRRDAGVLQAVPQRHGVALPAR